MISSMKQDSRIFVGGHRGMVGSAIVRHLRTDGCENLILKSRQELDLLNQKDVHNFFREMRPQYVFLAAAKVGGIVANAQAPAEFLFENLTIATNVIHAAHLFGVEKLLFLGSSCIYPKLAPQPIEENSLLTGPLEVTNEAYALAKIAGLKLCQAYSKQYGSRFISAMPTNLYGPNDNYDLESSHVIPALIRKFHSAKVERADSVTVWGTGTVRREFLHVDDLASALVLLMEKYESSQTINVGTGDDLTIAELAELVREVIGFEGQIIYDKSKPDGTPRKVLNVSKISGLGWRPRISLRNGLESVYQDFLREMGEGNKNKSKPVEPGSIWQ